MIQAGSSVLWSKQIGSLQQGAFREGHLVIYCDGPMLIFMTNLPLISSVLCSSYISTRLSSLGFFYTFGLESQSLSPSVRLGLIMRRCRYTLVMHYFHHVARRSNPRCWSPTQGPWYVTLSPGVTSTSVQGTGQRKGLVLDCQLWWPVCRHTVSVKVDGS